MLLFSDARLNAEETVMLNNFFIQIIDRIGKICAKAKEFLPEVNVMLLYSIFKQMWIVNMAT